jgi:hypothetical protein
MKMWMWMIHKGTVALKTKTGMKARSHQLSAGKDFSSDLIALFLTP